MMRIFIALLVMLLSSCSDSEQAPLVATDVVITAPVPGAGMSAAYLTLTNNTDQAISISRITSAQYKSVQLHETTIKDGIARMRAVPELEIPAGGAVTLQRGGKHIMLMRPTGSAPTVAMQFFDGDDLILTVDAAFETEAKHTRR